MKLEKGHMYLSIQMEGVLLVHFDKTLNEGSIWTGHRAFLLFIFHK